MLAILKFIGWTLLALFVGGALLVTIVPRFLDRIYYRGPVTDHFDGERFFNPDGDDTARPPGPGGRGGFIWRQLTGSDGRPPWPTSVPVVPARSERLLQPFLAPIWYGQATPDQIAQTPMTATWIGHTTVLVQTPGLNILTDPIWSAKAGPFGLGPRRVAAPGIAFDDLPKIDVILLSHNHYDHMDLRTLKRLWTRDRPTIVTSLGNDAILRSNGIEARSADWGEAITVAERPRVGPNSYSPDPVRVIVNRNHHWGSRWFTDRNRALWSSFVVKLPGGNLFFAGDTGMGDGRWPVEAASHGPIRLALLPIGAFRFAPGQMGSGSHIGPVDAVEVFRRTGATTAIPIHWGTFRLSYEARDTPPRLLAEAMRETGQTGFAPVGIGAPFTVPPLIQRAPAPEVPRAELLRRLDTAAVRAMQ